MGFRKKDRKEGSKTTMVRNYIPTGKPRGRPKKAQAISQPEEVVTQQPAEQPPSPPKVKAIAPKPPKPDRKPAPVFAPRNNAPSNTAPIISPEDEQALSQAIEERGEHLQQAIDSILSTADPRRRAQIAEIVSALADGVFQCDLPASEMPRMAAYRRNYPEFMKIWHAAVTCGDLARRAKREAVAHRHAVEGTEKPVFQGGALVGHVREFDHRLLEFLLKADDPKRYRETAASVNVQHNVQQIVVMHRRRPEPTESPAIPVESSESVSLPTEDATIPLPQPTEEAKPQ